jgi:small subunit ribosomal protein S9
MEVVNALGRRKSAVARVFVSEGTGKITINKRDLARILSFNNYAICC